ncbi:MAG TPA: hypothetical protein VK206_07325 [Anaerolineales bacterium]|nr:hypothetical protein [Anaerolineales bacterium]HLO28236.1 hypothetical protein [Anaerolineales bacterium]
MKNLIGGLFETQESANRTYEALQQAGFPEEQINTFVHKPRNRTARKADVKIQDIARNAFFGALIVGIIGGFIGYLVGIGKIVLPGLESESVEFNSLFLAVSMISGLVAGVLTGAILGVASKLLRSKEKAEVMTDQIRKRGVLVVVSVDGVQSETRVRHVMEENGATEVGHPSEKWDLDAWSSPNEISPSLKNLVNPG